MVGTKFTLGSLGSELELELSGLLGETSGSCLTILSMGNYAFFELAASGTRATVRTGVTFGGPKTRTFGFFLLFVGVLGGEAST